MDDEDDKGSHLSVVVDLSPFQWHLASQSNSYPISLETFLPQLLVFLNSHVASKHENSLAVFGAFPGKSVLLYSSSDTVERESLTADANTFPPFRTVDSTVVNRIMDELDALSDEEELAPCALVGALTKALCYVNRVVIASGTPASLSKSAELEPSSIKPLHPRILILSVSPDLTPSYIPIMNSIFSAQKLKVTIDACQVFGPDTVFLQQAAHLTNGSYLHLERRDALLQYLIMSFLSPPSIRKILSVPTQDKIDFRAACFCHKNIIDIGFVCSVCLSIFCSPVPVCSTCRTKFPMKTLQRLHASKPSAQSQQRPSTPSVPSTPSATSNAPGPHNPSPLRRPPTGGLPHSASIGTNGYRNGVNGTG